MADPIKYGWLPDKQYDAKLKREIYGWRSPEDFFIPNELARGHFANLGSRKAPYKDYDEYWSSFGQKPQGAGLRIPFDDDRTTYAKRYRDIFRNQPLPKRPAPPAEKHGPPAPDQEDTDDYEGLSPEPGGDMEETRQFGEPVVDDPWTQSDTIQLQRMNQDLASLSSQVNEGVLYEAEAEPEKQALVQERQQLLQRQQKAQLAQKGQMRMQQQDEFANQHKMQQANVEDQAANFTKSMPIYTDPVTGQQHVFYPDGKGGFTPLDTMDPVAAVLGTGEEGETEATPAPSSTSGGNSGHTMTIDNGPFRSEMDFNAEGKTTGSREFDRMGNPVGPNSERDQFGYPTGRQQQEGERYGLGAEDIQEARTLARLAGDGYPPGQRRSIENAAFKQVLAGKISQNSAKKRQEGQMKVEAERAQQQEQAQQRRTQAIADRDFATAQRHAFDEMQREITAFRKKNSETEIQAFAKDPANANRSYLWNDEDHKEMARQRAEASTMKTYGKEGWVPPGEKSTKGAAESAPAGEAAKVPEALNKVPASAIEEELKKRAAAKAGPGILEQAIDAATRDREEQRRRGIRPPSKFD